MSTESDTIVFTGVEGPNCHQFIRTVREQALAAGKPRDDQWIADYASIRFDGEALKWFESLEDETQSDWKLLRRAILTHYAGPTSEESTDQRQENEKIEGEMSDLVLTGKDKDECRRRREDQ
ncbi:hypothetical protein FRC00_013998 [Tulasnella sp. 408]|nr:hypothetical protein FRC00_013998 [Tulasnella sp. 408]